MSKSFSRRKALNFLQQEVVEERLSNSYMVKTLLQNLRSFRELYNFTALQMVKINQRGSEARIKPIYSLQKRALNLKGLFCALTPIISY